MHMNKEVRILMLEDEPASGALVKRALRQGDFAFAIRRVETKHEFLQEIEQHTPDVILSDHGLPSFDAFAALNIARAKCPNAPFIFVTGHYNEDEVVEAVKRGAADYVSKDRLARLLPAVQRSLEEVQVNNKKHKEHADTSPTFCLDALFATAACV